MDDLFSLDREFVWHPYAGKTTPPPVHHVSSGEGCSLVVDGKPAIDGISSWWCAAHGHRAKHIVDAVRRQLDVLPHTMFAGLTHEPAVKLAAKIASLTPHGLKNVFYLDSGSVAVEAAVKMAIQYQYARGRRNKCRMLTVRGGYHGDTLGAMALCDPVEGMHKIFENVLIHPIFVEQPRCRFGNGCADADFSPMKEALTAHRDEVAAVILEPIFQGASGMYFYDPGYLVRLRELCRELDILLIFDEIATGFGRTGRRFAANYAEVSPDIMCIGKALTGGVITLACAIATDHVSDTISRGEPGVFMHGPTFMANPLACAAANASLELFDSYDYLGNVARIEKQLKSALAPARALPGVRDVRALGAVGVIEFDHETNSGVVSGKALESGVWLRPFGRWLYTMPPFVISENELDKVCSCMLRLAADMR